MIRNNDNDKLIHLEKKNLRYLNLFRLFISLFFFILINNDQVASLFETSIYHQMVNTVVNLYVTVSVVIMLMT